MTKHGHEMRMLNLGGSPFARLWCRPHLAAKGLADRGIETTSPGIAGDFNGEMQQYGRIPLAKDGEYEEYGRTFCSSNLKATFSSLIGNTVWRSRMEITCCPQEESEHRWRWGFVVETLKAHRSLENKDCMLSFCWSSSFSGKHSIS